MAPDGKPSPNKSPLLRPGPAGYLVCRGLQVFLLRRVLMFIRPGITLIVLAVISVQGCSKSDAVPTHLVTGTVTMGGKPIEKGSIVFDPADGHGTSTMGGIENGQFSAKVLAGEVILRISAVRTTDQKDQYGSLITESYIPAKYNLESQLRKTVTPNAENKFDLVLD
jgi:hypothetical protein